MTAHSSWDIDYYVEGDSDHEDIICGRPSACDSSSDDELEKSLSKDFGSMENELNKIKELSDSENTSNQTVNKKLPKKRNWDDCINYDLSSDSDEDMAKDAKPKTEALSNDDLLYDPDMDDQDQVWMNRQRSKHRERTATHENGSRIKSDAILSCPACMSTVCIDCQRHEFYRNQYRAMFVMNVSVKMDEVLRYEVKRSKGKKRKKSKIIGGSLIREDMEVVPSSCEVTDFERYHPVKCCQCNTEVAVYDQEEVYHFFNVLASQA